ncbi:MAG: oxidoreductase [Pseudomonadota bacterium]
MSHPPKTLFSPLELPSGAKLKNRIAKSAMSDSLGDGCGNPSDEQLSLYETWALGGVGLCIIGEVQGDPNFAEKPGNLVLRADADLDRFRKLAAAGSADGCQLWLQLGHAGALAHPPISTPKGPSVLDIPGLACDALSIAEVKKLPAAFAQTARLASTLGFEGVEVHAAHGFLLSQFLSPLFNKRADAYGGSLANRMRLLMDVIAAIRDAVPASFSIGLKLNATDNLVGGFTESEALEVITAIDGSGVDLVDVSGGTYFPGARSASDTQSSGAYFLAFALEARKRTSIPIMATGGFKSFEQARDAIGLGVDAIGLARALILDPQLPNKWRAGRTGGPTFPRFADPPEGGVTAWYTMGMTHLAAGTPLKDARDLHDMVSIYEGRDKARVSSWNQRFHPDWMEHRKKA